MQRSPAVLGALLITLLGAEDTAVRCQVGAHVVGLSQINIAERSADVDLYFWTRCPKGTGQSEMSIALMNAKDIVEGDIYREDVGDVSYQSQRIQAQLKVPLSLKHYPFDKQRIVIDIEASWSRKFVAYILDPDDGPTKRKPVCCLDESVELPDWKIESVTAAVDTHRYGTSFGFPGQAEELKAFERLRLDITAHREVLPYFIKYLLPLLIILAMAYARCFWGTDQLDSSTAVVSTALLAVVALHLAHATGLPEVGYLVTGDLFFIHSELVLVAMLAALVLEYRLEKAGKPETAEKWASWERRLLPPIVVLGWGAIIAGGL